MAKSIEAFSMDEITAVLKAILYDGMSTRQIQRDILGLPAATNGGGYDTQVIWHTYNIKGKEKIKNEYKGLLKRRNDIENLITEYSEISQAINIVTNYIEYEKEVEKAIDEKKFDLNNSKTTCNATVKRRIHQDVLRKRVLDNYNNQCAICNINQKDLLICSHIIPWSADEKNRLNPQNAICLCALHDKLFDRLYFSLDRNYKLILSKKCDDIIKKILEGLTFRKPKREEPDNVFLSEHLKSLNLKV